MVVFKNWITLKISMVLFLTCMTTLFAENIKNDNLAAINNSCKEALEFYLDRPDLETEFKRRLEFCNNVIKDKSPTGYYANPIVSDFKSMYGVNGRTRMQIHQGIDIIGKANEPIIAIADGKVLDTANSECVGPTLVIDHGDSLDDKKLITIYTHVGDFLVKEGESVKRGMPVAKLPEKIQYPCMARVRHLHLQIGQKYCEKEEQGSWGCNFFIKDLYSSLNPHDYWADGPGNITCFDKNKKYENGTITYPFICKKM